VRFVAALTVVLACAAVAPPARASVGGVGFYPDQVEMDRAVQAADEYWRNDPQNTCLGMNRGSVDTTFPERHSEAAGYTRDGECGTIHVLLRRARTYTRWQFCTLVVHEYGHTINHVHVEDPTDIMYFKPVTAGLHPRVCDYPDPHFWLRPEGVDQTSWR
jgi:hypothetical protein